MSQPDAPKIEFPCEDYPVKVMGDAGEPLRALVLSVFGELAPGFDVDRMKIKDSSKGSFQSITVMITATGVEQLSNINDALRANPIVKMVL